MKNLERTILVLLALLTVSGCTKDNLDEENTQFPSERAWYSIVSTDTINSGQLLKSMSGSQFSSIKEIALLPSIVQTTFKYHSVNGTDTLTLSGTVCWPIGLENCSNVVLENHYFCTRWDECPSQTPQAGMLLYSYYRFILVAADYQGLGLSRDLPYPYLNTVLLARQSIDCFKAAISLLRDMGSKLTDDYNTYNIGYSLGGAVTMAIARQVELEPGLQDIMHVRKSFCGGGPYDQKALFMHFLKNPDKELNFPIEFPCALMSMYMSYQSGLKQFKYSDLFSKRLLDSGILEALETKEYTTGQICSLMEKAGCTTLNTILSAQIFDQESDVYKAVINEVNKLDLTVGWTPKLPIYFRHSKEDTYVPIACLESVLTNMADNPNITYDINEHGTHQENGLNFYINLLYGLKDLKE